MSLRVCVPPSPQAAVVSCLLDRRTINGSLQKQFLVRWVGEAQSDSWHDIDAFIWRPEDLEALSRREGFARLEDDPWYPVGLHTTEGTISSILRQKGAAAEEARAAAEAKAAEEAEAQRVAAARKEARSSQFRGPCKDFCKHCACCVSADGTTLYRCVKIGAQQIRWHKQKSWVPLIYILPLCLHMCLCPQQGGDPCPGGGGDRCGEGVLQLLAVNPFLCCWQKGPPPPCEW